MINAEGRKISQVNILNTASEQRIISNIKWRENTFLYHTQLNTYHISMFDDESNSYSAV